MSTHKPTPNAERHTMGGGELIIYVAEKNEGWLIWAQNLGGGPTLSVSLDCHKSSNVELHSKGQRQALKCVQRVRNGHSILIATLTRKASRKAADLQWDVSWEEAAADPRQITWAAEGLSKRVASQMQLEAQLASFCPAAIRGKLGPGDLFVDVAFPPVGHSVGMAGASARTVWRRPLEFMPSDEPVAVFADQIEASDIMQGELGNCWFMCSVAALTEFPHLIENLFVGTYHRQGSGGAPSGDAALCDAQGLYVLRFCIHGAWVEVCVDDYFPCRPEEGGGPLFSQAHGPELWVLLLEKAYAKLQGSYYACRLGSPHEALIDLTGAPVYKMELKGGDVTFADFLAWDRCDCLVCASTPGVDELTEAGRPGSTKGSGLVPGHAYTVVQARRIT